MKVRARKELEGLSKRLEAEMKVALKEREELGLSVPQQYDTCVTFYNDRYAKASAELTDHIPTIYMSALPLVIDQFQGEDRERIDKAMDYFDTVRDFLGNPNEDTILSVIYHPVKTIRQYEESFGSEQALKEHKDLFKERSVNGYDSYKKWMIKNAKIVRETLKEMLPKIETAFERADLSALRHEMDHIDFFGSPLYLDYCSQGKRASELGQRLDAQKDKSVSKEYAQANMELLEADAKVSPPLEIRALFFSYVKPNEWDKADFEDVKKKVYGSFIRSYVERTYLEFILGKLISLPWSNEEMNRYTFNYLLKTINEQRGSPRSAMRYVVHPEKVNYEVANRILYQELPRWKNIFAANGKIAVEVIGNAYRDDPSRLRESNKARTFKEFLELCKT